MTFKFPKKRLNNKWKKTLLSQNSSIRQAIRSLEKSSMQIVLVVNPRGILIGTITDGDIRRGLLSGLTINDSIKKLINFNPLIGSDSMTITYMRQIMLITKIHPLPITD